MGESFATRTRVVPVLRLAVFASFSQLTLAGCRVQGLPAPGDVAKLTLHANVIVPTRPSHAYCSHVATDRSRPAPQRELEAAKGHQEEGDCARPHRSLGPNWSEPSGDAIERKGVIQKARTKLVRASLARHPSPPGRPQLPSRRSGRKGAPSSAIGEENASTKRETVGRPAPHRI